MTLLLNLLLGGKNLDATLAQGAKELKSVGARKNPRSFRVTKGDGFATTEIYPNSDKTSPKFVQDKVAEKA